MDSNCVCKKELDFSASIDTNSETELVNKLSICIINVGFEADNEKESSQPPTPPPEYGSLISFFLTDGPPKYKDVTTNQSSKEVCNFHHKHRLFFRNLNLREEKGGYLIEVYLGLFII